MIMRNLKKITAIILCLISIVSAIPFSSSAAGVPLKPTGLTVDAVTAESVTLSWNPSAGATGYRVFSYLDGKWKIMKDTRGTTVIISGLDASKTYRFAVKSAVNDRNGLRFCDGYASVKVKTTGLVSISLSGKAGLNSVELSWSRSPGACGYAVYQYIGNKWKRIGVTSRKRLSGVVKNLQSSTTYYFGVRPYTNGDNGVIMGEASNILKIRTLDANKVTVKCAAVNDSAAKLVWSKAKNANGYRIYAYVSGKWKAIKDVFGTNNVSFVVNNLSSDSKYYFRVRAFNKKGSNVMWFTPSDTCTVVTNPGVKDIYIHRVENLRSIFEADSYTFTYDNVTRQYGTIPVTIAKNEDSFYLHTEVNRMPYTLLEQDEDNVFILLDEIESYIKVPSLFAGYFNVKSTMEELLPGEDWTAKASIVTFNSQKVVCETFVNPLGTKMLKFYFKTGELIAIEEYSKNGIEARALVKDMEISSDPSLFLIPEGYGKLFFSSLEDILPIEF